MLGVIALTSYGLISLSAMFVYLGLKISLEEKKHGVETGELGGNAKKWHYF